MFQIVSGMPLRLKFRNICTRRQITMLENSDPKRFAKAISDNRVNSTQKTNIDIDIWFQLKNKPNKFILKVLFLKVKSVQDQKTNFIAILDESSSLDGYKKKKYRAPCYPSGKPGSDRMKIPFSQSIRPGSFSVAYPSHDLQVAGSIPGCHFRLSILMHVRKEVSSFGKKLCVKTWVRKPVNT